MNLKQFKEIINKIPDFYEDEEVDIFTDNRLNQICVELTSSVSYGVPYPAVKIRNKRSQEEGDLVINSQFGWPIN